jgi:GR25 family glycosyltransferase involved in LPS biosynthesis
MSLDLLHIDKHYCINLSGRTERKDYAQKQFDKLGIEVEFFPAVNGNLIDYNSISSRHTPGMVGCFLSHRAIWIDAIGNGYKRIMVWEDDAKPLPHFNTLMGRALPKLPMDWEFLYLGHTHYGGFYAYREKINEYFVIPGHGWGTQCYAVNGPETMLKLVEGAARMQMQIDEQLIQDILPMKKIKYYFIQPNAVYQHDFISDVQINK